MNMAVKPPEFGRNSAGLLDRPRHLILDIPHHWFTQRLAQLEQARLPFVEEWKEISDFIRPRRGRHLRDANATSPRQVDIRDRDAPKIINNTPMLASRTLRSGMQSGASSPARPWFKLSTPDPGMAENAEVKQWLTTVARTMATIFARSNVYNNLHTGYGDLGDFGQSCMVIDEDYDNVIHTHLYSHGEFFFASDDRGMVNTIYRVFSMTVAQVVRKWGRKSVSAAVMYMYDAGRTEQLVSIVEAIEPNMQQVQGAPGPRGAPFLRVYFERVCREGKLLSMHPLHEWPACCPRWEVAAGESYGWGPGLECLPDAKALQFLERRKAVLIDKAATPPTQSQGANASDIKVNHRAGGHTFYQDATGSGKGVSTLYDIDLKALPAVADEIRRHEERCQRAYYADVFMMLAESDRREITAREIDERKEEKLIALGPVIERQHRENLEPLIDRTFNIMLRARGPNGETMVPPPPKILEGVELKTVFISVMAQAQRAVAVGGIERLAGFVGSLSAGFPSALDKFDADQAVDEYADALGVPAGVTVADDAVDRIRKDKQKAAQGQAMAAMATQGADTAKVLSETQVTPESLLGQVMGGVGAA